jgi:hypothetical protein
MRLHLTSIIPLVTGLVLLLMGSMGSEGILMIAGVLLITWGIISHTKNVKIVRDEEKLRRHTRLN